MIWTYMNIWYGVWHTTFYTLIVYWKKLWLTTPQRFGGAARMAWSERCFGVVARESYDDRSSLRCFSSKKHQFLGEGAENMFFLNKKLRWKEWRKTCRRCNDNDIICMYSYIHISIFKYRCIHIFMYIYIYMYIHIFIYSYIHIFIYSYIHTFM